jgi:hypothetical protein
MNRQNMTATSDARTIQSLVTMVRSGLVPAHDLRTWADDMLLRDDAPPLWLCNLALAATTEAAEAAIGDFEPAQWDGQDDDEHLACVLLQYEEGRISWAQFLALAGAYTDVRNGHWPCEEFYMMLNEFEAGHGSVDLATRQFAQMTAKLDPAIHRIRSLRLVHVGHASK